MEKQSSSMYLIILLRVMSTEDNLSSHIGLSEITREAGIKSKISRIILTDVSEKSLSKIKLKGDLSSIHKGGQLSLSSFNDETPFNFCTFPFFQNLKSR